MYIIVNIVSESPHTSIFFVGMEKLKKQGLCQVEYQKVEEGKYPTPHMVECIVDGKKVAFDYLDGYNFKNMADASKYIESCDLYFKRSFSNEKNDVLFPMCKNKIRSLGFNFYVTCINNPIDWRYTSKGILQAIRLKRRMECSIDKFEQRANRKKKNIKILFLTRLYKGEDLLNKMRAEIILKLKDKYPNNFIGGLYPDEFSKEQYPDLVVDSDICEKQNYMRIMKKSDICIATTGLHESIGWKMGEYVAVARGIVSEKLNYRVPGNFKEEKNYLVFSNIDECIDAVDRLYTSPSTLYQMKKNNEKYYKRFGRPDKQIWNALCQEVDYK